MEVRGSNPIFYIYKELNKKKRLGKAITNNLQTDQQSLIKAGKIYLCRLTRCTKSYEYLNRLLIHLRTHVGCKPYMCKICGKSFNEKGNLKTHSRIHTGERPYQCPVKGCSSSFKAYGHLRDHKKSHLNLKEFQCDICKKSFSRSSVLKIHKAHHKANEQTNQGITFEKTNSEESSTNECASEMREQEHHIPSASELQALRNTKEIEHFNNRTLMNDSIPIDNTAGQISVSNEMFFPLFIKQFENEKGFELEKYNNNNYATHLAIMKSPLPLDIHKHNNQTPRNNKSFNPHNLFSWNSPTEHSPFPFFFQSRDEYPNIACYNSPGSKRYFNSEFANFAPKSFSDYARSFDHYFGN